MAERSHGALFLPRCKSRAACPTVENNLRILSMLQWAYRYSRCPICPLAAYLGCDRERQTFMVERRYGRQPREPSEPLLKLDDGGR